jgi:flagellar basal body-associated protein FliL
MAERADKKSDAGDSKGGDKEGGGKSGVGGAGGLLAKTPVLLAGVMLIEAVVLFAGFKFVAGGPRHADAADVKGEHGEGAGDAAAKAAAAEKDKKPVEIPLVDFRATNKSRGRTLWVDVSIFVVTRGENEDKVRKAIKDREALIKDRVSTIIRQSDPEKLSGGSEPGLETLRRQVKYQLDEIVGEGMIDEVLVPRCIPLPAE